MATLRSVNDDAHTFFHKNWISRLSSAEQQSPAKAEPASAKTKNMPSIILTVVLQYRQQQKNN
jgi:hypothetical protein